MAPWEWASPPVWPRLPNGECHLPLYWLVIVTAPAWGASKNAIGPAAWLRTAPALGCHRRGGVQERQAWFIILPELGSSHGWGQALAPGADPRFPASLVSVGQTCLTLTRHVSPAEPSPALAEQTAPC